MSWLYSCREQISEPPNTQSHTHTHIHNVNFMETSEVKNSSSRNLVWDFIKEMAAQWSDTDTALLTRHGFRFFFPLSRITFHSSEYLDSPLKVLKPLWWCKRHQFPLSRSRFQNTNKNNKPWCHNTLYFFFLLVSSHLLYPPSMHYMHPLTVYGVCWFCCELINLTSLTGRKCDSYQKMKN